MKRVFGLVCALMLLPSLAHAQFTHASFFNGGTTLTATCTNTAGTVASQDSFLGTLQGNTTVTLPAAAAGCNDYDVVDLRPTAVNGQSYTLTVSAGTGTATQILSNGGNLIAAPAGASGGVNGLHQIWVYNKAASTPQWELVTQETNPATLLTVNAGGTGASTFTAHALLLGEGTGAIAPMGSVCGTGSFPYGQSGADPVCSTLTLPNAASNGDILGANATNTMTATHTPTLGNPGTTSGVLGLASSGNSDITSLTSNSSPGAAVEYVLPSNAPSTANQVLASGALSGGFSSMLWTSTEDHFSASQTGTISSTAGNTLLVACIVATNAGHFANLDCTTDVGSGSCTTAPGYNVRDNTASTVGTAKTCGNTAGTVDQTQTLTFSAGDTICIVRTANAGTCTIPVFNIQANLLYP